MGVSKVDTPNWRELKLPPNWISVMRLIFIPYLFLMIIQNRWIAATLMAVVLGLSDFVDGYIARRFSMQSALGALLDPLIDRIFIISVLIAMVLDEILSLWILLLIISRDVVVAFFGLLRKKSISVTVVYVGKMGTWFIFVSIALLFLAQLLEAPELEFFSDAGIIWGVVIYWLAGWNYLRNSKGNL